MLKFWTLYFKRELEIHMGAEVYRNQIIQSVVAPDLVPYCLRHTYCTDLQRAGVPLMFLLPEIFTLTQPLM